MDITKSREDFEAWFDSRYAGILALPYFKLVEVTAMEAWQASRESIEVDLPMRLSPCRSGYGYTLIPNDIGEVLEYEQVVEKLRTAGIRIKGESE